MKQIFSFSLILVTAVVIGFISFVPDYVSAVTPETSNFLGGFTFKQPIIQKTQSVRFVGDIMLGRDVEALIKKYSDTYPYKGLPLKNDNSFLVGNFESSIPEVHTPTKNFNLTFSVNPNYLDGLSKYGFTHLGIANNHSYDFGYDGYLNTFTTLEAAGLNPFGDQMLQATSTIRILETRYKKVALVGVFAVDTAPTQIEIETLLKRAENISDIQVVFIHWGDEYKLKHNKVQEKIAQQLIDAGADVIVGHHPHVVQDIGLYKNVPIFYSLGNFIFDQYFSADVQNGLTLTLQIDENHNKIILQPVTSIGSRAQPRYMPQLERDTFLDAIAQKSDTALTTMIQTGEIEF